MSDFAKPPLTDHRRERKRRLLTDRLAAIAYQLFEQHGYEAVTMEQVAAAADVAKGTLYKYFAVKEALLAHQLQRDIAARMAPLWQVLEQQSSFAAQMQRLLHASARWNEAHRRYLPHYVRFQFGTPAHRRSQERQLFERLCVAGRRRGDLRADLAVAPLAAMLESLCLGAILSWLATPGGSLKTEFDAVLLVALNGMAR